MGTSSTEDHKRWLDHRHYRTYEIALGITDAVGTSADLRDLEFLADGITEFIQPWQKYTAVHRFARVIGDEMFIHDTLGPYVQSYEDEPDGVIQTRRYLPVDIAMRAYGIDDGEIFEVPKPDGKEIREGNIIRWVESTKVADACYGYTVDLQWTARYESLLKHLSEEVFHTIFPNRSLLGRLHEVLAIYVRQQGPESLTDRPELARLFDKEGRLKRATPPQWVRRAIFFREQGYCAMCGANLTGLLDALPARQFDHLVPLDRGGLNDVSNLQLLCQPCNRQKSADLLVPTGRQRRYYALDRRR